MNADFLVFGHKFREFFPQMGSSQQMKSSLQTLDFDPVQLNGMTLSGDQSIHDQALIAPMILCPSFLPEISLLICS
jgi:hypothetical protein